MNIETLEYIEETAKTTLSYLNHRFHRIQAILLELVLQPIVLSISLSLWDFQLMTVR